LFSFEDVFSKVLEFLKDLGYAGNEKEAKILYLALTTRIFDRPVNVIVKGPSGAGKSF
jgi:hypothetical protein